ncbi:MAG: EamA family transporter RarD [Anaerovoracaceae bacterium]|nr:EamA family transporter RarD [Anaerovoracaceae bacterium]
MNKQYRQGMMSAIGCAVWWGIMPIYWQTLQAIDSMVIIFYRIVLVAAVCFLAAVKVHGMEEIRKNLRQKGVKLRYFIAGALITLNWSIYIWAVNANMVIQTCIGYYIEPLLVCVFGVLIFKEKLNKYKITALVLAAVGVLVVILHFRQIPAVALGLGLSFSVYAAIKKNFSMPPLLSLLYETMFLLPPALMVIIGLEVTGNGAIAAAGPGTCFLLMFCGLFTAFPLVLFANAANKVDLFALGITEYISPTISLIISIFLFQEPFDGVQLAAFAIIWVGLAFFSFGEYRKIRQEALKSSEKLS